MRFIKRLLLALLVLLLSSQSWAAIVRHCHETASGTSDALTINKPTSGSPGPSPKNVASGDLLLIWVGNDGTETTCEWDSAGAPAGFTFGGCAGDGASDAHVGMYWRIADGTEGASFNTPHAIVSHDTWAVIFLISGTNSSPIHMLGADSIIASGNLNITGMTTTIADCYIMAGSAYDGGDDGGYTTSDTGWAEVIEVRSGTTSTDAGGDVSEKQMSGTGATLTVTHSVVTADGQAGFQVAILPAGAGPPPCNNLIALMGVGCK